MKYFVEYITWNSVGTKTNHWGIVEFAFRKEITKKSIRLQLVPDYEKRFRVVNMVKL